MLGSAIATAISDIPFDGPTASTQVGLVDGELVFNPTAEQKEKSDLALTVASTREKVIMFWFSTFCNDLVDECDDFLIHFMRRVDVGRVAKQANGAVLMHYGDTVVLSTATASDKPREGIDFFPLSVEYNEKLYAVGKIPGGFNKREGKASENAVLTCRVIDRPMSGKKSIPSLGLSDAVAVESTTVSP